MRWDLPDVLSPSRHSEPGEHDGDDFRDQRDQDLCGWDAIDD
jgi:hypothetical protein